MLSPSSSLRNIWAALAVLGLACLGGLSCSVAPSSRFVIPPAPAQCVWDGVERVVAVGDLHGDFDAFVAILQDNRLLDENNTWIGGKAHLVQLGDVMDRGDHARDIFVLISRLEREAAEAGGMVHFLPGNHEELNLARVSMEYKGYVSLEQFKSFLKGSYRSRHERLTARMSDEDGKAYWNALMGQTAAIDAYYDGFRNAVGGWIIGHSVIIKINGVVFVHGGIAPEDSRRTLESINAKYRQEFIEATRDNQAMFQFVFQEYAPLWNRDLGENGSSILESDVRQILSNLKARAIVVGHTPTPTERAKHFGGLVWFIDSNISSFYEGESRFNALVIDEKGEIGINEKERHDPKKRRAGLGSVPGHPGDLRLRVRLASAPGNA
jgi:hypothetical protein